MVIGKYKIRSENKEEKLEKRIYGEEKLVVK